MVVNIRCLQSIKKFVKLDNILFGESRNLGFLEIPTNGFCFSSLSFILILFDFRGTETNYLEISSDMGICFGSTVQIDGSGTGAKVATALGNAKLDHEVINLSKYYNASTVQVKGQSISSNLKSFSFNDLRNATKNFTADYLIGEGGFGFVFKGWIHEHTLAPSKPGTGMVVAVKKLKAQSFQGHREWLTELNFLGALHHENLVKLIGYCSETSNRLLIYEFMPKGSLENHLFKRVQPLDWATRMQIAIDVARGLTFLHSLDANVIYRDMKPSNILIDSKFHAKLSDFGLARNGPSGDGSHVSTRVVGTIGYAAPEYLAIGHLSPKSDVYSFGVVLLELLSGKRAQGDETIGRALVDWVKPFLDDSRQFSRIMDTRLRGVYFRKSAQAASFLALRCISNDPQDRPSMAEALSELEQFQVLQNSRLRMME